MQTRTLIVGGGLSGLALADRLHRNNSDFLLLEAASRFGGRIKSETLVSSAYDLGPAWVWHGQPRIKSLIERFSLQIFDQHSNGEGLVETADGRVLRGHGYASMRGSLRLTGGLGSLVDALVDELPSYHLHLSAPVTKLQHLDGKVYANTAVGQICAQHVVIATAPRIAQATISFNPVLPANAVKTLQSIPTWMAGQAKILAVYENPFWRENGLSGDAMSQRGPLVEIHDASADGTHGHALFGFVGIPAEHRHGNGLALKQMAIEQLVRMFGKMAAEPSAIYLQDWAQNDWIATQADFASLGSHPTYGRPTSLTNLWNGKLFFASTEMAQKFGGFLEGALEASETLTLPIS